MSWWAGAISACRRQKVRVTLSMPLGEPLGKPAHELHSTLGGTFLCGIRSLDQSMIRIGSGGCNRSLPRSLSIRFICDGDIVSQVWCPLWRRRSTRSTVPLKIYRLPSQAALLSAAWQRQREGLCMPPPSRPLRCQQRQQPLLPRTYRARCWPLLSSASRRTISQRCWLTSRHMQWHAAFGVTRCGLLLLPC